MDKIKSRKLWVTIGVGVVYGILGQVGIKLPDEVLQVVIAYLCGQSAIDIANVIKDIKNGKKE